MLKKISAEFLIYLGSSLSSGFLLGVINKLLEIFQKQLPYSGMFYAPTWNGFWSELPIFIFYYLCQGLIFLFLVYFIKYRLEVSISLKHYLLFGFLGGLLGIILGLGYTLHHPNEMYIFLIKSVLLSFIPGLIWLVVYNFLNNLFNRGHL